MASRLPRRLAWARPRPGPPLAPNRPAPFEGGQGGTDGAGYAGEALECARLAGRPAGAGDQQQRHSEQRAQSTSGAELEVLKSHRLAVGGHQLRAVHRAALSEQVH